MRSRLQPPMQPPRPPSTGLPPPLAECALNADPSPPPPDASVLDGSRDRPQADLVRDLETDILFGRLRPRERLVEDALMERFGAKRHQVRAALAELERRGIVVKEPYRGCAVRDFSTQEIEDIYELRVMLQQRAVQRMPLPATAEALALLQQLQHEHDAAVQARDLRRIDRANEAFHAALFGLCGNRELADAIGHYAYVTRPIRLYPMANPEALERLRTEHWRMLDALRTGDRAVLEQLVLAHIEPSKRAYLEVRRIADLA